MGNGIKLGFWLLVSIPALAQTGRLSFDSVSRVHAASASGPASWLARGPGPLALDPDDTHLQGQVQVGLSFQATRSLRFFAHGLGRAEPSRHQGANLGLVEAFAEWLKPTASREFRIRGGWFFPTSSLENTEPLWGTPYTLTLSAVNSWLAEEMRFSGLDMRLAQETGEATLYAELSLLSGNDSLGALIAWRGWSMGQRLTVGNETLPLPPLSSLEPGGTFSVQNPAGTQPITRDLDGRTGGSLRLAFEHPAAVVSGHLFDNQGDRELYRGDYAWRTEFYQLGAQVFPLPNLTFLFEGIKGQTGMGNPSQAHVEVGFYAWYLLSHLDWEKAAFSLRYDQFETDDRDSTRVIFNADANQEEGSAFTVAAFWQFSARFRLGMEWLSLKKDRALLQGQPQKISSEALSMELSFRF